MQAALRCVCRHVFASTTTRHIYALCFPENVASHAVLRAAGFHAMGPWPVNIVKDSASYGVISFGINCA
jgi:RimJ/RimL family protein N-acetyltransferase